MSKQVIKQPDGKYSLYSIPTGSFIVTDASADDLITIARDEAANEAESFMRDCIDRSDTNVLIDCKLTLAEVKDIYSKRTLEETQTK